jgi:hypothetical protein
MSTTESLAPHLDVLVKARELLNDHEVYHSEFQIRWFIITRNGGTSYGCYKQALLEIDSRLHALHAMNDACTSCPEDKSNTTTVVAQQLRNHVDDAIRELRLFCDIAIKLKKAIGPLDPEKRYRLETELWSYRVRKMAVMDFMTEGRLCRETVDLLLALPSNQRQELVEEILTSSNHAGLMHQFLAASYITEDIEFALPKFNNHFNRSALTGMG